MKRVGMGRPRPNTRNNHDYGATRSTSAVKKEDIKFFVSTINADMSHTYGNAISIIENELVRKFPNEFFKTKNISTNIALKQRQKVRNLLDLKAEKPILGIQPRLNVERTEVASDFIRRMYGTNMYDLLRPDYHNEKFFKDTEKLIYMDFSIERASMEFDTVIRVSTHYQQLNVATHMINNFRLDVPYYFDCTMEIPIPNCILERLANDSGVPIYDENKSVSTFLSYINGISRIPIMYKLNSAKGSYNFFLVITNSMYIRFGQFSMSDDGNRDGQIADSYDITMPIICEFNYPNCFFYISKNNTKIIDPKAGDKLMGMNEGAKMEYVFNKTIIPERKDEKVLHSTFSFDVEKDGVDDLNIQEVIDPLHLQILNSIDDKLRYKNATKFIDIDVYENERLLISQKDYNMNWADFNLILLNSNTKKSYRLIIYINNNILNDYKIKTFHNYSNI